jgi:large subunit ribosomal protein L6
MSRVAKQPIHLPKGVEVRLEGESISVKGPKGTLSMKLAAGVTVAQEDGALKCSPARPVDRLRAMAGTTRALLANVVRGVTEGYSRRLDLVGVGYRAQVKGSELSLTLGFSHPVSFPIPEGISIETPSQTEVVVKGTDKHRVGQVAADIRAFRPPEPYKGKGVRYHDETVVLKEAKKK